MIFLLSREVLEFATLGALVGADVSVPYSPGQMPPRCCTACAELHVFLGPSHSLLPGRWTGRGFRPAHVVLSCSAQSRAWGR